jgi:hypothetical protein
MITRRTALISAAGAAAAALARPSLAKAANVRVSDHASGKWSDRKLSRIRQLIRLAIWGSGRPILGVSRLTKLG